MPEPTYISDSSSFSSCPQNYSQNYSSNSPKYPQNFSSNSPKYPQNYPSNSQNTSRNNQNTTSYRHNSDASNSNLSQNIDNLNYQHQCPSNNNPLSDPILNRLSNLFLLNTLSTFLSRAGSRIRRHNLSFTSSSHTNLEEFTVVIPVLDNKTKRKSLNDSPMKNPPFWKRLFWMILTVLNVYSFIGTIGTLEFAPRLMNIYQIHLYTNGRIGYFEALAIMFGKKELYLLYGKHHITYKQVSNVSYTSDALTFIYWAFLSFMLVSEIQKNLGNTIDYILLHNRLDFLMFTLLSVITLIILKILWGLIKRAVYFADRHADYLP
ncbi:1164_t:CDS:2 [Gigaspora margarita]|uniref:1164_t:CDS:1 n=1 Tax=Gigaspora margarita TaxID=4874 RepID=A0ABM8W2K7_GIGMA|nr:1164_t:CDS:2 [Gigaspora margarita]